MKDKITILSLGENFDFISRFRGAGDTLPYCFIQVDYESFENTTLEFDVLLFSFEKKKYQIALDLFCQTTFLNHPPVILICNDDTTEEEIDKVPFPNKLIFRAPVTYEELKHNIDVILEKTELERKIHDFEKRVRQLDTEIMTLRNEVDHSRINIEELSQTNMHLASATWRERANRQQLVVELENVKKENELNKLNINELSATNEHLIAATWRERDLKKQLKEAMEAVNQSKEVIQDQNKRIEQSINYAQKIQNAITTREVDIKSIFPQSSMYFRPKDVISGDFPWMFEKGDYVYMAAVDCTGHGVPGAMMSMIGNLLLNDLMHESGEYTPGQLLDRLHTRVVKTLKQDAGNHNANDGMDIAMIRLHKRTNEVVFASAHRPLLHMTSKGENFIIKGDKFPIGGLHYEKRRLPFTDTYLKIEKGDMLFLFTDGLTDQIGGEEGKKIGTNTIFDLLSTTLEIESEQLSEYINQKFENWKGGHKQIDDVLLIALRY